MDRRQEKRIIYICLLGFAAIVPLALNPEIGAFLSLIGVICVAIYIRSDLKMMNNQRGFPVIMKEKKDTAGAATAAEPEKSDTAKTEPPSIE